MTDPVDLPDTFPDARDREHHSGAAAWLVMFLAFGWITVAAISAALIWWG